MKAKKVIKAVKEIKEKKEHAAIQKQEAIQKKEFVKQTFHKFKAKCVCKGNRCAALGLKQSPKCIQEMKSVYSKIKCRGDGGKPRMIIPSAQIKEKRRLFPVDTDESGESENEVVSAEDSDQEIVGEI